MRPKVEDAIHLRIPDGNSLARRVGTRGPGNQSSIHFVGYDMAMGRYRMDSSPLFGTVSANVPDAAPSVQVASLRPVLIGFDATSENEHLLPTNVLVAGYSTQVGTNPPIKWTPNQWARHIKPLPALRIDQDPNASDYTADYLDVETNAATDDEIVRWITNARISYNSALRPGQRWPGIYCSRNNVDPAVVVLQRASLVNVPFIVADYSLSVVQATLLVQNATGPYPERGAQYDDTAFGGFADADVWDEEWASTMSGNVVIPPPTVKEKDMVILSTKDASGATVTFTYDGTTVHHIVSDVDQNAFAKVLPVVDVTPAQFTEISGVAP